MCLEIILGFIVFQKDGSFIYKVGDLDASGDWFVQKSNNSNYVLKLNYSNPKDTIRFLKFMIFYLNCFSWEIKHLVYMVFLIKSIRFPIN